MLYLKLCTWLGNRDCFSFKEGSDLPGKSETFIFPDRMSNSLTVCDFSKQHFSVFFFEVGVARQRWGCRIGKKVVFKEDHYDTLQLQYDLGERLFAINFAAGFISVI